MEDGTAGVTAGGRVFRDEGGGEGGGGGCALPSPIQIGGGAGAALHRPGGGGGGGGRASRWECPGAGYRSSTRWLDRSARPGADHQRRCVSRLCCSSKCHSCSATQAGSFLQWWRSTRLSWNLGSRRTRRCPPCLTAVLPPPCLPCKLVLLLPLMFSSAPLLLCSSAPLLPAAPPLLLRI